MIYRYDLIDKYLKENKISKKQICERCNFSIKTLYKFYQGRCVYVNTLVKLCNLLDIKICEFVIGCER